MPLPGLPKLTTPKQETLPEPGQANPTAMSIGLALAGMAQGITNQNTLGLAVAELERQRHRLAQTQAMNLGIENDMAKMEAELENTRKMTEYKTGVAAEMQERSSKTQTKVAEINARGRGGEAPPKLDPVEARAINDYRTALTGIGNRVTRAITGAEPFPIQINETGEVLEGPDDVRDWLRAYTEGLSPYAKKLLKPMVDKVNGNLDIWKKKMTEMTEAQFNNPNEPRFKVVP